MLIEQIWLDNPWRNFNYLIACEESSEALAIDPLDHKRCLQVAADHGWTIKQICNTHEHPDHIEGNQALIEATGASLLAPSGSAALIPGADQELRDSETITVGKSVSLKVIDSPGHTMHHLCLYGENGSPALFCGDTLFNAGVGNCHNGGDPEILFKTITEKISKLPNHTRLYPGHDYMQHNLGFTLDREPGNRAAQLLLDRLSAQSPHSPITTLGEEKEVNTFFRLESEEIIEGLKVLFEDLDQHPEPLELFLKLRLLRDNW